MSKYKEQYRNEKDSTLVSLKVHNIGFELCDPNHTFSGMRDFFSVHHIVSGKGRYTVGERTFDLKSGDTFVVFPDTKVTYVADTENPWEYYWLGISGAYVKQLLSLTDFSKEKPYIRHNVDINLKKYFLDIYNAKGNNFSNEIEMIGLSYVFLSKLVKDDIKETTSQLYAKKAKEIIDLNYSLSIKTEEIASKLNISRSHLHRVFVEAYNISPGKYLSSTRIRRATFLLKNTTLSINEIALSIGYENQLYFSNSFKKHKNLSPTEYRKLKTNI